MKFIFVLNFKKEGRLEKGKRFQLYCFFKKNELFGIFVFLGGRWIIEVNGAPGTLYANEMYQLQVDFPEHYPMEAPQVSFPFFYEENFLLLFL